MDSGFIGLLIFAFLTIGGSLWILHNVSKNEASEKKKRWAMRKKQRDRGNFVPHDFRRLAKDELRIKKKLSAGRKK